MKCIKKGDEIVRVEDMKADSMVKEGWSFCAKKLFKSKKKNKKDDKKEEVVEVKETIKEAGTEKKEKKTRKNWKKTGMK